MSKQVNYLSKFGISEKIILEHNLIEFTEPKKLVIAEKSANNTSHQLIPSTAIAWNDLQQSALQSGETVFIVSAFRSIERQAQIIQNKLDAGQSISEILKVSTIPGYSEHHCGRAVDIGTHNSTP